MRITCGDGGSDGERSCVSIRGGMIAAVSLVPPGVVEDDVHADVYDGTAKHVVETRIETFPTRRIDWFRGGGAGRRDQGYASSSS